MARHGAINGLYRRQSPQSHDIRRRHNFVTQRLASLMFQPMIAMLLIISLLPMASAFYPQFPPGSTPTQYFQPLPTSQMNKAQSLEILYDLGNDTGHFRINQWVERGMLIREGNDEFYCLGNLSWALKNLGPLVAGTYSGAASTLALLPTAGALIGAPTKELWLLFKLMPIAGGLTMLLSLGGTLSPSSARDYKLDNFTYGGVIATEGQRERNNSKTPLDEDLSHLSDSQRFARRVYQRAQLDDEEASGIRLVRIWTALLVQVIFLVAILVVMWYGQRGAVIPWWCKVWGWMYFWFFMVIGISIIENWSSSPFSKSWMMRVSRTSGIIAMEDVSSSPARPRSGCDNMLDPPTTDLEAGDEQLASGGTILDKLARGMISKSKIRAFHADSLTKRRPQVFYVIISKEGVPLRRAVAKIFSTVMALTVYTFGTALFASAQLMSITMATIILSITLGCAALGRINGMFIASEINSTHEPVLHKVVGSLDQAAEYVESILVEPDLVVELKGLIIVNGKVVAQKRPWLSAATYIGLLAPPVDLRKLCTPSQNGSLLKSDWNNVKSGRPVLRKNVSTGSERIELLKRIQT